MIRSELTDDVALAGYHIHGPLYVRLHWHGEIYEGARILQLQNSIQIRLDPDVQKIRKPLETVHV